MDNLILRIVITSLAVFRLSELFAIDDGPFEVLAEIRGWLNKAPLKHTNLRRTLADGIVCRHCNGVWFSILLSPTLYYNNTVIDLLLIIIAISGIQSILVNKFGREI